MSEEKKIENINFDFSFLKSPEYIESWSKILEAIAWPFVFFIIVFILRNAIRKAITKLAERVKKLGTSSIEFENFSPMTQSKTTPEHEQKILDLTLKGAPIVQEFMDYLEPKAEEMIKESGLSPETFYKTKSIENFISWQLERAHNVMFGSQIKAIEYIVLNGGSVSQSKIKEIYNDAKDKYPEFYENFTFEMWINYLIGSEFIIIDADLIHAKTKADAFVTYLTYHNLIKDKLF